MRIDRRLEDSHLVEGVHGEKHHPGDVQRFNDLIGHCGFTTSTSSTQPCGAERESAKGRWSETCLKMTSINNNERAEGFLVEWRIPPKNMHGSQRPSDVYTMIFLIIGVRGIVGLLLFLVQVDVPDQFKVNFLPAFPRLNTKKRTNDSDPKREKSKQIKASIELLSYGAQPPSFRTTILGTGPSRGVCACVCVCVCVCARV